MVYITIVRYVMEKLRACFFTGHRVLPVNRTEEIRQLLREHIERLIIEYDVRYFISGGAIGFDTEAAEAVIEMREKYPHIKLVMYLPCYGQSSRWDAKKKYRYRLILSKADETVYITEGEYEDGCMQKRNARMIQDAFFCIAFCMKTASGTGATLRAARDNKIINIVDEMYE